MTFICRPRLFYQRRKQLIDDKSETARDELWPNDVVIGQNICQRVQLDKIFEIPKHPRAQNRSDAISTSVHLLSLVFQSQQQASESKEIYDFLSLDLVRSASPDIDFRQ
jgi:hypothetical protein